AALAGLESGAGSAAGATTMGGGGGGATRVTSIAGGSGATGGWPQLASTADSTRAWTARVPAVAVSRSRRRRLAARPSSCACAPTLIDFSQTPTAPPAALRSTHAGQDRGGAGRFRD